MDDEELDELVSLVEPLREQPWNKPTGRPRKRSLRDAVAITCAHSRQNVIQEVLAEWWEVSQEHPAPIADSITDHHLSTRVLDGLINEYRYVA